VIRLRPNDVYRAQRLSRILAGVPDRFTDTRLIGADEGARIGAFVIWNEITVSETADADRESVVIRTVGSTRGHGLHTPLNSDTLFAHGVSLKVAKGTGALVLPPLCCSYEPEAKHFPRSASLGIEAFLKVLEKICHEPGRKGSKEIVLFNGQSRSVDRGG